MNARYRSRLTGLCVALSLAFLYVAAAPAAAPQVRPVLPSCDVDRDGNVDRADLSLIKQALRHRHSLPASTPFDARDANRDGHVTSVDRALCRQICTRHNCKDVAGLVNAPPMANAGADQTVYAGVTVTLDGSASSDPDGDSLTYTWSFVSRPAGSSVELAPAASVSPKFVADVEGSYVVRLVVTDEHGSYSNDDVTVTTMPRNTAPVANAGPDQAVKAGQKAQLDGSASSDVDGDSLSFSWALEVWPAGSTATLSNAATVKPSLTPDKVGLYIVRLTVNDGRGGTASDTVDITTQPANRPPVANAGADQATTVSRTVLLDGSASSDADGDAIGFKWSFVSRPAGSAAQLRNETLPNASFVADKAGDFVVQLIVNDGEFDSDPDTVRISTGNVPPVANAGSDQDVKVGALVQLNGNGSSDANGDPLGFLWSLVSRPTGSSSSLADALTPTPKFTADTAGLYVVQLVVNDGTVDSAPDTANISATEQVNRPPVANDDSAATPAAAAVVINVLANDTDADSDPLVVESFSQGTNGSVSKVAGGLQYLPNSGFAGSDSFSYVASDGRGGTDSAVVTVTVAAAVPTVVVVATDPVATEPGGDMGSFTLTRSGAPLTDALVVSYTISGTATADADYLALGGSLTIPAGQDAATLLVKPKDDTSVEPDETVVLTLSTGSSYVVGTPAAATVTIKDNDVANRAPVANAGLNQTVYVSDTIALDGSGSSDPDGDALTYAWSVKSAPTGAAVGFSNSAATNPTVTVSVPGAYVFQLIVNDGQTASAPAEVAVTVLALPTISIGDAGGSEGNSGTVNGTFEVSLSAPIPRVVTVQYATANGTATAGEDYVATSGTATFPANTTSQVVKVQIKGDTTVEPDESFYVDLSAPVNATVLKSRGTGTIYNDDVALPSVTVLATDAIAAEPGSDTGVFTVTRSGAPTTDALVVSYTVGGTATAGTDYQALSGSVTILAGQSSATITLTPRDDQDVENDETVVVTLTASAAYTVGSPADATVTIRDDDTSNRAPVASAGTNQTVYVIDAITLDGTGSSDPDGDALTYAWSVKTAPPGASVNFSSPTAASPTVSVSLAGSYVFQLIVSDGKTTSSPAEVTVTVLALPTISIGDATAVEGNSGTANAATFIVSLAAAMPRVITVQYATASGTATAGNDYIATTGTVTFPANTTASQPVIVPIQGDTAVEPDETFYVDLTAPTNATLANTRATGTIINDDVANRAPIANAGSNQSVYVVDTITLNGSASSDPDGDPLTYAWTVSSAPPGAAVVFSSQSVANPTVTVNLAGTYVFRLVVNDGQLASAPSEVTITVLAVPTITIGNVQVTEGNSGTVNAVFPLTLSASIARTVTVQFATTSGTATSGEDFVAASGTVTFPANSTSPQNVSIQVNGDTTIEPNEVFYVDLTAPANATLANTRGTATIVTDDLAALTLSPGSLSIAAGATGNLTVTLPAPAGAGGAEVTLSSNDTSVATVPATVTVPASQTSVGFQVQATNKGGSAQITASAAGYASDTVTVTVTLRGMTLSLSSPLVAVGRSVAGTVTLAQAAPTGGVTVGLSSSATGVATVSPSSVFIAAGDKQAAFTVNGISLGNATIAAAAAGYANPTAGIAVTNNLISFGNVPSVAPGQTLPFPVSLSSPAAGDVVISFSSDDPSIATVTSSVLIPSGLQVPSANPTITGVSIGNTVVRASAAGFAPDAANAVVTLTLSFNPTTLAVVENSSKNITLELSAPAPSGGLTVSLASGNAAIASVPAQVVVSAGQTSATVAVTGVAPGSTSLTASHPGLASANATINVTAAPPINLPSINVGRNLQDAVGASLGVAAPTPLGVTVTITSSDPSRLLLSTGATLAGSASIDIPVAANATTIPAFYVQALDGSGTVNITASAPGYASATTAVALFPSGFVITSPGSALNTTTFSSNTNIVVTSARLNTSTFAYLEPEAVRAGIAVPISVSVESSNGAVGTIIGSPLTFTGNTGSQTAQFDPLAEGSTTISVVPPAGFDTPSTFRQLTATVTGATINVPSPGTGSWLTGEDLQDLISITLAQAPPAAVDVTVSVGSSAIARVSNSPTVLGDATLVFPAVGDTSQRTFYLQGMAQGVTTVTISAPGYTTVVRDVTVHPSGFVVASSLTIATTTFSPNSTISVFSYRLTPSTLAPAEVEPVRAGLGPISVSMTSSNTAVGTIVGSPLSFGANVSSQNAQFDPIGEGTSTLALVTPPGFDTPASSQQVVATVTGATISVAAEGSATYQTGEDLQDVISVTLLQAPPAPVDLTVTVGSDAIARVSSNGAALGSSTVTFAGIADTATRTVYLQGLQQGGTTVTFSAPGYSTVVRTVTVGPSGFVLSPTTLTTTVFSSNTSVTVNSGRLNPSTLAIIEYEAVRPGISPAVSVAVTSSNPAVGAIVTSPLTFGANVGSNTTQFDPLTEGATTVSLQTPTGFDTPSSNTQLNVTVNGGTITAPAAGNIAWLTGEDLQAAVSTNLAQAPPSGVDLTVTVSSDAIARVSNSATSLGAASVTFSGVTDTSSRTFYLQGVGQGTATLTISAPGYVTVVRDIEVHPSAFVIGNPASITTTASAANTNVDIYASRLNPSTLVYVEREALRPGLAGPVNVDVTSSNTAVGVITTSPVSFGTNVNTVTTQFDPLAAGTTTLTVVTPPGFDTAANRRQITATVNP